MMNTHVHGSGPRSRLRHETQSRRRLHLSMSQMPLLSSSLRLMGMDGRKWPSRPVVQPAGISQIRKKPSTWSMRYAWKYLQALGLQ